MNVFKIASACILLPLCLAGCGRDQPATAPVDSDFQARLAAALEISNLSTRDDALHALALAAAEAGEGEVALNAVQAIANVSTKDQAGAEAATHLADAGEEQAALDVARQISNLSARDQTLKAIAQ